MRAKHWTRIGAVSLLVIVAAAMAARPTPPGSEPCREVLAEIKVMQADLVRMDRAMEELLSRMNAASDEDRIASMHDVIETLVAQRAVERQVMKGSHQKVVLHLMRHVLTAEGQTPQQAFDACLVMKQMTGSSHASGM